MKIIIADDEAIVRIGLKSIINWEENGFEIVGEASDGNQALDLILSQKPDIAIIDMKMPLMDGLDLMHRLIELKKSTKILVLSSHDDFYLVKEAMKLGAEDYLLKLEIEPDNLIDILKKIANKIEEEHKSAGRELNIDKNIVKNMNVMRKNFLRDVIGNFYTNEKDLMDSMNFLNLKFDSGFMYCFMIKIGELYRFEDVLDGEIAILNYSIINTSEEIVNDLFNGYCFEGKTGEFFILASSKKSQECQFSEHQLMSLAKRLKEMLLIYLNITATIGIGIGTGGIKGVNEAYNLALGAIRYRFFKEDNGIILWKDVKSSEFQKDDYSILNIREELHKALLLHQKKELKIIFNGILDNLHEMNLSRNVISNLMIELFIMINEFFESYGVSVRKIMKNSYHSYQQLVNIESIGDAKKWVIQIKEDLIEYIKKEDAILYPRIISRIKNYIEKHFDEELSLKEVADAVSLNPSYLSTILKTYTDMSYSVYVAQVRVGKAKKLLKTTDYKVYEVGEKVGYTNVYYFNRIFKKIEGLSPGEYKKRAYK